MFRLSLKNKRIIIKITGIFLVQAMMLPLPVFGREPGATLSPHLIVSAPTFQDVFRERIVLSENRETGRKQPPQGKRQWSDIKEKQLIQSIARNVPFGRQLSEQQKFLLSRELRADESAVREKASALVFIRNNFLTMSNDALVEALNRQAQRFSWNKSAVKRRLAWFDYTRWDRVQKRRLWELFRDGIEAEQIGELSRQFKKPPEEIYALLDTYENISKVYFDRGFDALCLRMDCDRNDSRGRALRRLINEELGLHIWTARERVALFERMSDDWAVLAGDLDKTPYAIVKKLREFPVYIERLLATEKPGQAQALVSSILAHGGERAVIKLQKLLLPEKEGGLALSRRNFRNYIFSRLLEYSFGGREKIRRVSQEEIGRVNLEELKALGHVVVRGVLQKDGVIYYGRRWGKFPVHGGSAYQLEFDNGVPVRIFFEDEAVMHEFFPIISPETGEIIAVHTGKILRDKFLKYGDFITTTYLAEDGRLALGGGRPRVDGTMPEKNSAWGKLGRVFAGEKVRITVRDALVTHCASLESNLNRDFVLVWKKSERRYVSAFLNRLYKDEFDLLGPDYELHGLLLSKDGSLNIGSRENWIDFSRKHGYQKTIIDDMVNVDGETFILGAKVTANGVVLTERRLAQVFAAVPGAEDDFSRGALVDVFEKWSGRKLVDKQGRPLTDYIVANMHVSANGYTGWNDARAWFPYFAHAAVEFKIINGEKAFIKFLTDKEGNPVTDYEGNALVIDLRRDILTQLAEKSPVYGKRRLESSRECFEAGRRRFKAGDYRKALMLFVRILYLKDARVIPLWDEDLLSAKIGVYIDRCREKLQAEQRIKAVELLRARIHKGFIRAKILNKEKKFSQAGRLLRVLERVLENMSAPELEDMRAEIGRYRDYCRMLMREEIEARRKEDISRQYEQAREMFYDNLYPDAQRQFNGLVTRLSALPDSEHFRIIKEKSREYIEQCVALRAAAAVREKELRWLERTTFIFNKAQELFFAEDYNGAVKGLKQVFSRLGSPDCSDNEAAGIVLRQAESLYQHCLKIRQLADIDNLYVQANELKRQRKFKSAIRKYRKIIALAGENGEASETARDGISECLFQLENNGPDSSEVAPFSLAKSYNERIILSPEVEAELVEKIRCGDAAAKLKFVEQHIWMVKKIMREKYRFDQDTFDEFVQEGIVSLYGVVEDFVRERAMIAEPFRVFAEQRLAALIDEERKKKNGYVYKERSLYVTGNNGKNNDKGSKEDLNILDMFAAEDHPQVRLDQSIDFKNGAIEDGFLVRALKRLAPQEKVVLIQHVVEDKDIAFIAAGLGIGEDEVKEHLQRAIQKIRQGAVAEGVNLDAWKLSEDAEEFFHQMLPLRDDRSLPVFVETAV